MANEEKKVEEVEAKEPAPDDIANKPAPDAPNDDREQAHPLSSEELQRAVKTFEERKKEVDDKISSLRKLMQTMPPEARRMMGVEEAFEEETDKPALDDIGEIIAAAVKGQSNTASVLDKPALNDINEIIAAAKEVFGAEAGLRWLGTPVPALQYATPISLVETEAGRQKIHDALVNLTHGNW